MKKFIFINTILFMFAIIACNHISDYHPEKNGGESIKYTNEPPVTLPRTIPFDSVGIMHNQGCDYIYQILANKKLEGVLSCSDSVLFYIQNSGLSFLNDSLKIDWVNIATDCFNNEHVYFTTQNFDGSKLWTNDVEDSLTLTEKELLIQLDSIIDNGSNLPQIISGINNLQVLAQSECSDNELNIIMPGLSVAKHSLAYWHDNLNAWQQLPYLQKIAHGHMGAKVLSIDWKKAAKADVAGAIAGGVSGAALGAIYGAIAGGVAGGVGAIPGAIAGAADGAVRGAIAGAISATVYSVMTDIMNSWF